MAAKALRARHAAGVYRRSIGAYLRSIAEYPTDFWVMAIAGTTWQIMLFAFLSILFGNVNAIAGWDYLEMLILAGFLATSWGSTALFWDGIWDTGKLIVSPMPGLLVSIEVEPGQEVKAGQAVAVIEAMKMQNIIRAERDATVKAVGAKPGDSVAADEVLIEFA